MGASTGNFFVSLIQIYGRFEGIASGDGAVLLRFVESSFLAAFRSFFDGDGAGLPSLVVASIFPAADHLWSLLRFVELSESQLAHFPMWAAFNLCTLLTSGAWK